MNKKNNIRLFLTVLGISLALIAMGRVSTQFTAVASTDVAFPEWVAFVFSLISELIVCARIVMGCAGLAQCAYHPTQSADGKKRTALPAMLTMVIALSLTDYLARFFIDYITGAITGTESLAVIWLLLQFLYEAVFLVMSMLLILLQEGKFAAAQTARSRERHSSAAAVRCSVLLILLSRVVLEVVSIIEFVTTYSDITTSEIASMIGSIIKILVIYGGGAMILGEIFTDLLKKSHESPADPQS